MVTSLADGFYESGLQETSKLCRLDIKYPGFVAESTGNNKDY